MAANDADLHLKLVSFNMHGFFQGHPVIEDLISSVNPDIIFAQEHWLTSANLNKFETYFNDYFTFGISAMSSVVESGMLKGRPFGGVATLMKNNLRKLIETVYCSERYVIVRVGNYLLVNVYLPCVGTANRLPICEDILFHVWSWKERFHNCKMIIAGDFNVDLDGNNEVANLIARFINDHSLTRADLFIPSEKKPTYVNTALGHESQIDYILFSDTNDIERFAVIDPSINFSDHLPLLACFACSTQSTPNREPLHSPSHTQLQLRWDKANLD